MTIIEDLMNEPHRQPVIEWLRSRGFIVDRYVIGIAWSCRSGIDFTDLEFYPLARHAFDLGWDAIIGHHASGDNPRLVIGRCETIADVQMVYDTIRRINGYPTPEDERPPSTNAVDPSAQLSGKPTPRDRNSSSEGS